MQPTLVFRRPIVVREGVKIQRGLATYSALAASMNTVATASGCHGSSMFSRLESGGCVVSRFSICVVEPEAPTYQYCYWKVVGR